MRFLGQMVGYTLVGRFIGTTSCGFVTGHCYKLRLSVRGGYLWADAIGASCPYSSIKTFAENWEIPVNPEKVDQTPPTGNIW